MDSLHEATLSLLARHPSPALPVEEVRRLLHEASPHGAPDAEQLLARLTESPRGVRVLARPARRWLAPLGPRAWILAPGTPESGAQPACPVLCKLRASLLRVAEGVESDSPPAWARWTRLLDEEARVRRILKPRRRGGAPDSGEPVSRRSAPRGTQPSTIPPRGRSSRDGTPRRSTGARPRGTRPRGSRSR